MTEATILIVDDEPLNLTVLADLLKRDYRVLAAKSGEAALRRASGQPRPDLILLDVMMPDLDGHAVCKRLKADPATSAIPVIFVTALGQAVDEAAGLEMGAVDYITKPISPAVVRARITTHLALSDQTRHLERLVDERTRQVALVRDATIVAMASLAETRDNETGNHIRRTQNYVRELARAMAADPRWAEALTDEVIELLYKSAPLHDIGKVGIPDHILLKPGRLTADEFEIMKTHAVLGRDAIATTEEMLGGDEDSFLRFAREIAYTHQEKWDGSGYPQGLKGEEIPLSGRLMAVADVYDALISKRVYKPAFSHEEAVRLISEGRGGHFDPEMVDVFLTIADRFRQIAAEFSDRH